MTDTPELGIGFSFIDPVVSGAAFYLDGISARTGPPGDKVSVFASSAEPGFSYRLVSGQGTAQRPCSTDVVPLSNTVRFGPTRPRR